MSVIGELEAVITADASSFIQSVQDAVSSLSELSSAAQTSFAALAASQVFGGIARDFQNIIGSVVGTASTFQTYGQTIGDLLDNIGSSTNDASTSMSGFGSAASASALEAQDAFIKYQEKVQEIQQNIQDILAGQNIVDAQQQMADQLSQIAQNYADKIQSINDQIDQANQDLANREASRQQSMQNTLTDMQDSHQNQIANTTEEYQQKIANARTDAEKAALQKQLNDKLQLLNDEFDREYSMKQSELQRNLDQQNAADTQANAQKLANLNSEIDKENKLNDQQVEKVKSDSAKKIATYEDENAKKLALYKKELGDEERSYQLSLAKRASGGSSGGAANRIVLTSGLADNSQWSAASMQLGNMTDRAAKLQEIITGFALKAPFSQDDIENADQKLLAMGYNIQALNPIIGNIGGLMHQSFGTTADAIIAALNGRTEMLHYTLGISNDELIRMNGNMPIKTSEQLITSLEKLSKTKFAGGMQAEFGTLQGQMSNVTDRLDHIALAFMGIGTNLKPIPGGLFDEILKGLTTFQNFLEAHHKEIEDFFAKLGKNVAETASQLAPLVKSVADFVLHHKKLVSTLLIGLGIFATLVTLMTPIIILIVAMGLAFGSMTGPILLVIGFISLLVAAFTTNFLGIRPIIETVVKFIIQHFDTIITYIAGGGLILGPLKTLANHWKSIWQGIQNDVKDAVTFITNQWKGLVNDIDSLGKPIKDALAHINPFSDKSANSRLVDDVAAGVAEIKKQYASLANISLPSLLGTQPQLVQNYNYNTTTRSPNVQMTNTFNVQGEANASNIAEYMAFQLEHRGNV